MELAGRTLEFAEPDETAFPCLALAREAGRAAGTAPAILNAANEVVVEAFLDDRVGFMDIPRIVAGPPQPVPATPPAAPAPPRAPPRRAPGPAPRRTPARAPAPPPPPLSLTWHMRLRTQA